MQLCLKCFTLGLTRTSSRRPNVKPFICAQHAPTIGKTYKNTRLSGDISPEL